MTTQKSIILSARVISLLFTPFYLPILGVGALFTFSYMNALPEWYKWKVLLIVYLFTILLPTFMIYGYRKVMGWTRIEMGQKRRRIVPYCLSMLSYLACIEVLQTENIYFFICSIIFSALLVQITCAAINMVWKISTHMAAVGGVAGGIIAFTHLFLYNPIWWLCLVIFLSGLLGSARMILRQHTLAQVTAGFGVGFICACYGILRNEFFVVVWTITKILLKVFLNIDIEDEANS